MQEKNYLVKHWKYSGLIKNKKLLSAFKKIKRENFVLPEHKETAYDDIALPLGYGSTISQPSTIIAMLEALDLKEGLKVLEIGTGSGYTAAIISKIIGKKGEIFSIDIIPQITEMAKNNLAKEKIKNIMLFCHDGSKGLKKYAPYDRILVNAASAEMPKELLKQLKVKGIMVAPLGKEYSQKMIKFTKERNKIKEEYLGEFIFVPLQKR